MLMMEAVSQKKLIEKLEDVRIGNLEKAAFKAILRLQVFFTGRTHEILLEFGKQAQAELLKEGGSEGVLDGLHGLRAQRAISELWTKAWTGWQAEFQSARREAVQIPFGVLAVRHERLIRAAVSGQQSAISEAMDDGVFSPQMKLLLNVAEEYLYGDGLDLSDRIWRIENDTRDQINNVIMQGITDGDSAWNIAKNLEQFLGAGQDCPRWTSTRLYGRSASDKAAGDTTGLLSGSACDGKGVSYNALRLARTEIQKIHALATDRLMAMQPWVEMEKCHLSAAHPTIDECDSVVSGGEKGDGVYPVGTIQYPLHPNCFCYKTAVLMDEKEFTSQLKGWLNGESWPEMDNYAENIGVDLNTSFMGDASVISLAVWLFGESLEGLLQ